MWRFAAVVRVVVARAPLVRIVRVYMDVAMVFARLLLTLAIFLVIVLCWSLPRVSFLSFTTQVQDHTIRDHQCQRIAM